MGLNLAGRAAALCVLALGLGQPQEGRFEAEVKAYEASDKVSPPPKGGIVFVGSSSIRLWKTLAEDFPGLPVINRGFGGSVIRESTELAPRLIFPHRPGMIVFFAGTNDIAGGASPEKVLSDYQAFVRTVRQELPRVRLAFIALTPAPSRWSKEGQMREANRLVQNWIITQDNMAFINTYPLFLTPEGGPRPELFVADQLHLNAEGYSLWRRAVAPYLPWSLPSSDKAR